MNVLRIVSVVSLLSVFTVSCGGDSKSDDPVALCKQACSKGGDLCASGLGVTPAQFKAICEPACTSNMGPSGMTCTNSGAIINAFKACLNKTTCDEYTACGESVPACQGGGSTGSGGSSGTGSGGSSGTGTGGRSGTGGSSGGNTGGSSGGGGAAGTGSCATLQTCCAMLTSASDKATCQAAAAGAAPATCDLALTAIRAQGLCN